MRPFLLSLLLLAASPAGSPLERYQLPWTESLPWGTVVALDAVDDARLAAAQKDLVARGGGVLQLPAGTFTLKDDLVLQSGVIFRGADPKDVLDARDERYAPPTRLEFPRYVPTFEGEGTPVATAFRSIRLAEPATASGCGVLNIAINRARVDLGESPERKSGRNRFVIGCVFRNTAAPAQDVPDPALGQHAWQRWTNRFAAAIHVKSEENLLIANNRLPASGEDNFLQKGFVLLGPKKQAATADVEFDYDNRPGISANDYGIGGGGASLPDGTPESHPWGFRKGIVIRENFIFATGRCAITFTGDGAQVVNNVIRFKKGVVRWTATGKQIVGGTGTNDNRAVQMRGWRWHVEGNDYEVWRNRASDTGYLINDGEGLMHEDHVNSTILDSALVNNTGNSYLSLYKCGGIDGLLVKGNKIRTEGGIEAIYVVANRNKSQHPCRRVTIEDNVTSGSGIRIEGEPGSDNVIRNNRHEGSSGRIVNAAAAVLSGNEGYGP